MSECRLCPRSCGSSRETGHLGVCRAPQDMKVARADLHYGEEPVISGARGSGTIFFSHCPLGCLYCQNEKISAQGVGQVVSVDWAARAMLRLQDKGAHNINLVTGTQYAVQIRQAVLQAKQEGLCIPIVWNSSGYETGNTLDMLDDVVDVFMPDFKYWSEQTAAELSKAPDYPQVAKSALQRMFKLRPQMALGQDGTMRRGVLVRHLVLPGYTRESKLILQWLAQNAPTSCSISLMSQYTPTKRVAGHPLVSRRVHTKEYDGVIDFALRLGLENVFTQEPSSATDEYVPEFFDVLR